MAIKRKWALAAAKYALAIQYGTIRIIETGRIQGATLLATGPPGCAGHVSTAARTTEPITVTLCGRKINSATLKIHNQTKKSLHKTTKTASIFILISTAHLNSALSSAKIYLISGRE